MNHDDERFFCAYCGKPWADTYFDRHGIYAGLACNDRCAALAKLPCDYDEDPFEPIHGSATVPQGCDHE